ncbi:CRIB domain-containing protein RIC7-like isoform X1 [Magnolia sinica]|uniref:CRIB domain-containing protein RIC7-like isoform X1 n=1 Tax=Magnolia sinica TaxID=86752 RepID=UPI002658717C|nr:CRIB domain-containing protein RIC7-like isoform X1 [Magnolia sinica]
MSAQWNHMEPIGKHNVDSDDKGSGSVHGGGKSDSQDFRLHRRKNSVELFPPQMTTKMKGLFKGLRYISQIFDPNCKEHEMQIGHPTDVKHVAHIGWDGPSVNPPTWMNEYRSGPETSSAPPSSAVEGKDSPANWAPEEITDIGMEASPTPELPDLPKPSRRNQSSGSSSRSQSRDSSDAPRQPRRHQNSSNSIDSMATDLPAVPKSSRRKKSKGSSSGGSTRSGRSKAQGTSYSDQDAKNTEQLPAIKSTEEEKENDT